MSNIFGDPTSSLFESSLAWLERLRKVYLDEKIDICEGVSGY